MARSRLRIPSLVLLLLCFSAGGAIALVRTGGDLVLAAGEGTAIVCRGVRLDARLIGEAAVTLECVGVRNRRHKQPPGVVLRVGERLLARCEQGDLDFDRAGRLGAVVACSEAPAPPAERDGATDPAADGVPAAGAAFGRWRPGPADTCPKPLHDAYLVIGPDGKRYPTWHPALGLDPRTEQPCSFGHEHGRDPRGSHLWPLLVHHFAAPGRAADAGVPFGLAEEQLAIHAVAHGRRAPPPVDHEGYKIEWQNDVRLLRSDRPGERAVPLDVTCDFFAAYHLDPRSADALGATPQATLFAAKCSDGTELVSTLMSRFEDLDASDQGCVRALQLVSATASQEFPDGAPFARGDAACTRRGSLGSASGGSPEWRGPWRAWNRLRTADGREIAAYDPAIALLDPRRSSSAAPAALAPNVLFHAARRALYVDQVRLRNRGGPSLWWTDPFGGHASRTPFPGAIRQRVAPLDDARPPLEPQALGAERSYDAEGLRAGEPSSGTYPSPRVW